jgi:hypothetical protein
LVAALLFRLGRQPYLKALDRAESMPDGTATAEQLALASTG